MNIRRYFFIFVCLFINDLSVQGQQTTGCSPAESHFLEVILSDTISKTVCYLPAIYRFGTTSIKEGRFVLVKEGSKNIFMLEGTHRVFMAVIHRGQPGLKRIDSTHFTGDNFQMMAFRRKDTLYQYGGSDKWSHRDFLTRYRDWTHDWEFVSSENILANLWTLYQYQQETDALYVLGSQQRDHRNQTLTYQDSIYRYDFNEQRWSTLGLIDPSLPFSKKPFSINDLIAFNPMGVLTKNGNDYLIMDIPSNSIHRIHEQTSSQLNAFLSADTGNAQIPSLLIHLKDSLIMIAGGLETSIKRSISLTRKDLIPKENIRIYEPMTSSISPIHLKWFIPSAIILIAVIGFIITRRLTTIKVKSFGSVITTGQNMTRQTLKPHHSEQDPNETTETMTVIKPSTSLVLHDDIDLDPLRTNLTPSEWSLFETLITSSAVLQKIDADKINKIIGVEQSNPMTQKARRSIVINRINRIFSQSLAFQGDLIRRERDENEKRRYVHFMDEHMARQLMQRLS